MLKQAPLISMHVSDWPSLVWSANIFTFLWIAGIHTSTHTQTSLTHTGLCWFHRVHVLLGKNIERTAISISHCAAQSHDHLHLFWRDPFHGRDQEGDLSRLWRVQQRLRYLRYVFFAAMNNECSCINDHTFASNLTHSKQLAMFSSSRQAAASYCNPTQHHNTHYMQALKQRSIVYLWEKSKNWDFVTWT